MNRFFEFITILFHWSWKLISLFSVFLVNLTVLAILFVLLLVFVEPPVHVPEGSALLLNPSGRIVENTTAISPFSRIINRFAGIPMPQETQLQDILDAIDTAADDERIKIIALSLAELEQCSLNQLDVIGRALERFQQSGKKVLAIDGNYNQMQYYLASFADEIFLNPMGTVNLKGFGVFRLYMKELVDRLAVNFHLFRVGSYKSAAEPFIRDSMSDEDRESNKLWLTNLWNLYGETVVRNRNLPDGFLDRYIAEIPARLKQNEGRNSSMALDARLIDKVAAGADIDQYLRSLVGSSEDTTSFNHISLSDYLETVTRSYLNGDDEDRIGVIIANGNIMYGRNIPRQISSENITQLLRQAGRDEEIKAVVLRIDSAGGSAFASEQIRDELTRLQNSGKPVVISMGSLAASGGYWIAAGADKIVASPYTLTGSIGIFGMVPTFENTLAKYGISSDGVGTTKIAGSGSLLLPLPDEVGQAFQLNVEEGYYRFLALVAEGRGMSLAKVESIAQGRVWDGRTALEHGLIDQLGTLQDAIAEAGKLAGLSEYEPVYIIETPFSHSLMDSFGSQAVRWLETLHLLSSNQAALLDNLKKQVDLSLFFNDPAGLYSHCLIPQSPIAF